MNSLSAPDRAPHGADLAPLGRTAARAVEPHPSSSPSSSCRPRQARGRHVALIVVAAAGGDWLACMPLVRDTALEAPAVRGARRLAPPLLLPWHAARWPPTRPRKRSTTLMLARLPPGRAARDARARLAARRRAACARDRAVPRRRARSSTKRSAGDHARACARRNDLHRARRCARITGASCVGSAAASPTRWARRSSCTTFGDPAVVECFLDLEASGWKGRREHRLRLPVRPRRALPRAVRRRFAPRAGCNCSRSRPRPPSRAEVQPARRAMRSSASRSPTTRRSLASRPACSSRSACSVCSTTT